MGARRSGLLVPLVAVALLLSACSGTASPHPSAAHPTAAGLRLTAIGLARNGAGVAAGVVEHAGRMRVEVFTTSDGGVTFREVTPRGLRSSRDAVVDDAAVAGANLWVLAWDSGSSACTLYRSSDRGRTWTASPAPGHNMAAGSRNTIAFTGAQRGWLLQSMPTGPVTRLYRTRDGGDYWQLVSRQARGLPGPKPSWRVIERPGPAAYTTRDAGAHWQRRPLPLPAKGWLQVAAGGPARAWVLHTGKDHSTRLIATTDGGRSWTPVVVVDQTTS